MKPFLKKIGLRNFRNYESLDMELGRNTTVLIGKNGMGKTNLIYGIRQVLSFVFSRGKGDTMYPFFASSQEKMYSLRPIDARFGLNELGAEDYNYPMSISAIISDLEDNVADLPVHFIKNQEGARMSGMNFRAAAADFWGVCAQQGEMPVLAVFSDAYPHVKSTLGKNMQKKLRSGFEIPRNVGYYKWGDDLNCTDLWLLYYVMQRKNAFYQDNADKKAYVDAIDACMIAFSRPLDNDQTETELSLKQIHIEARGNRDVMVLVFENGQKMSFGQLPAGYRRIFSIVLDIASRSYILNKHCKSSGIVVIDEIELHLHPSLAQEILPRLQRTFPNIQFVVSTHSPVVVANYQCNSDNLLYKLLRDENGYTRLNLSNQYGLDYNTTLHYTMDTPELNTYLQDLKSAYLYWKGLNRSDIVAKIKGDIARVVGVDSNFYQTLDV